MAKALYVEVEARRAATEEIRTFLEKALTTARGERATRDWYAVRFDEHRFAIFDTFDGQSGRLRHIAGSIGRGLVIKTFTSLHGMPHVSMSDIVAAILPDDRVLPTVGLYGAFETKLGQGRDFGAFLVKAREAANREPRTLAWYALRTGPNSYAVFDAFPDQAALQEHQDGAIVQSLDDPDTIGRYLAAKPVFRQFEIIASKQSGWIDLALAEQKMHAKQGLRIGPKTA
jgi:quinol monooxygenase YgiN